MFELIAHRGASKEAPENTLSAFRKACDLKVDTIELDVHLSSDGTPIVIHDSTLGRTSTGKVGTRIQHYTTKEIAELDAGAWFHPEFKGEKIPTLAEALVFLKGKTRLMIEVKKDHAQAKEVARAVCECVKGYENLVVGSFSVQILEELRNLAPELPLMGIFEDLNKLPALREMKFKSYASWYKLLTPTLVNELHEEGATIWAFTVDDLRSASFLLSIGVDGIITNDPRLMLSLR